MPKLIAAYLLAAAAVVSTGSCYQDDATLASPARVQPVITVRLTDAPFPYDSLHSVNIYVVRIEANTVPDTSGGGAGQWVLITEPRKSFDLLALQQGTTAILGQGELPAGQYHAVRMTIDTTQSSITWNDAAQHPAPVNWHGWSTIYALVEYPVDVPTQGADIVLDFDVGRSLLFNYYGTNNEFDFTPKLRAISSAAAGAIAGVVRGSVNGTTQPISNAQVSVFRVFRTFCCQTPDSTTSYLEATGRSDPSGHYKVAFLPPGTYSVTIEEPFLPYLEPVTTPNAQVTAGDTTPLSVVLPNAASSGGAYLRISGPTSVGVGGSITLFAAVGDANGNPVSNPSVTWTTNDQSVTGVTGVGDTASITGKRPGSATITATSGGVSDSLIVQVVGSSAPVAAVTVVPGSVTAAIGDSLNFTAELRDSSGNRLFDRSVAWFTADSTKIELHAFGGSTYALVWARATGTAVLRATSEGKTDQATITVH